MPHSSNTHIVISGLYLGSSGSKIFSGKYWMHVPMSFACRKYRQITMKHTYTTHLVRVDLRASTSKRRERQWVWQVRSTDVLYFGDGRNFISWNRTASNSTNWPRGKRRKY